MEFLAGRGRQRMLVDARMLAVFSIIALLVVPSFAATVQITGEESL
jgi:hypothetical protein